MRSNRRISFSLIEISLAIVIITILLLLVTGFLNKIGDRQRVLSALSVVQSQINISRQESLWCKGVLFFFDEDSEVQKTVLIRGGNRPPLDLMGSSLKASYIERYADRFEIIEGTIESLPKGIRCCRLNRVNNELLHTFVIVFNHNNEIRVLPVGFKYIVHDPDVNEDGIGDNTFLEVSDIKDYWKTNAPLNKEYELYSDRSIDNIISFHKNDPTERYTEFEFINAFFVYEHNIYPNFPHDFSPMIGHLFPSTSTKLIINPVDPERN